MNARCASLVGLGLLVAACVRSPEYPESGGSGSSSGGSPSSGGNSSGGGSSSSSGGSSSGSGSSSSGGSSSSSGSSSSGSGSSSSGGGCPARAGGATLSIHAGGPAVGDFTADRYYSGGSTYSSTSDVDTSLIACNPPPPSLFQTERYGEFTYSIPDRTPGTAQTVTLYFQESHWTAAGQRTFDVVIDGATVLTSFDIFEAAGGANRAIARSFDTTADASGRVVVQFIKSGPDNPKVCGIRVEGEGTTPPTPTVTGPCDIYEAGGTPCVAAHSTVRALYGGFSGSLYQVQRASDGAARDIPVLAAGGFADSSLQDAFCAGTNCIISQIYDQSPRANHLTPAPGGSGIPTPSNPVNAAREKLVVGGHPVYAAYFEGKMGYRNNSTATGLAKGDDPESMYMVTSGTHHNGGCCFDYGNAETTNNDDGEGTMEALYFGTTSWGRGGGAGPWVMADLENGVWAGNTNPYTAAPSITHAFVTAMLKGKAGGFTLKAGDARAGTLTTTFDGPRPVKGAWGGTYDPMRKQGAIILGIGGDNSNDGVGTFYEGCITTGYSTNETDEAVQANIVAAGYGAATEFHPCPTDGTVCRIMPLGDSITDGVPVSGGYRVELFRLAGADQKSITFVGSGSNGPATVDGRPFPPRHEGHSGYTIDDNGGQRGIGPLVRNALATHRPHVVLLMIGTNDVNGGVDLVNAPGRLDLLLDRITTAAPDALVVVAQIIPFGNDGRNGAVRAYNSGVAEVVRRGAAAGKHLVLVDMYGAFTANARYASEWMADGLHPSSAGYAAMARAWYAALQPLLPSAKP